MYTVLVCVRNCSKCFIYIYIYKLEWEEEYFRLRLNCKGSLCRGRGGPGFSELWSGQ